MKFFICSFTFFLLSLIPVSLLKKNYRNSCVGWYDNCKKHPLISWGRVCCEGYVCRKNENGEKKCVKGMKNMGDSCFSDDECPYGGCSGIFKKTCKLLPNGSKCNSNRDCEDGRCVPGEYHHGRYRCTPYHLEKHSYWT